MSVLGFLKRAFDTNERELRRLRGIAEQVSALEPEVRGLSNRELTAKTFEFRTRLDNGESLDDLLAEAFAVVREAAVRVLGQRHFDEQIMGGAVLHEGRIAEMRTGEGKTLAATLPAYLNALTGKGVHIVTVNDYLARRDAEWMGTIYKFLGLKVGVIIHGLDYAQRRAAYAADITYGTNNEFGFDYLRDNMVTSQDEMVQRELNYAIVDEVDSILIYEARTPLIISGQAEESTSLYQQFARLVPRLKLDEDYTVDEKANAVALTDEGVEKAERMLGLDNLSDESNIEVMHHLNQALRAHALMRRDRDYIVKVLPGRAHSNKNKTRLCRVYLLYDRSFFLLIKKPMVSPGHNQAWQPSSSTFSCLFRYTGFGSQEKHRPMMFCCTCKQFLHQIESGHPFG
jgi:preprotein translocase subunit SecA